MPDSSITDHLRRSGEINNAPVIEILEDGSTNISSILDGFLQTNDPDSLFMIWFELDGIKLKATYQQISKASERLNPQSTIEEVVAVLKELNIIPLSGKERTEERANSPYENPWEAYRNLRLNES